ncbi:MAG: glucoamylase family protein, partial [Chitinophagaceae bacterium]
FLTALAPLLLFWIFSPVIAWKVSKSLPEKALNLSVFQINFLRKLSRRTWAYFEKFIGRSENWLPPDHYQEHPAPKLADYTSPTNIGIALLANLTACDFGYLTRGRLVECTSNTMKVLGYLERFKGHFYNWYNIKTLEPSHPRYVSTVDSGNLAGHLLVLRQGLSTIAGQKILGPELFAGLQDALELLREELNLNPLAKHTQPDMPTSADPELLMSSAIKDYVEKIALYIVELSATSVIEPDSEARYWLSAIERQCSDITDELHLLAPWLWLPPVPSKYSSLIPQTIFTLYELEGMEVPDSEYRYSSVQTMEEKEWLDEYIKCIEKSKDLAHERILLLKRMVRQCTDFTDMEYDFLHNKSEQLLSIGYHVDTASADSGYYDVLSSEARLAIYVAICQGKLPVKSWFTLGRTLVVEDDSFRMLSANGTMFEYLMPLLVMPTFENSLLDQSCKAAVLTQIKFGKENGTPWGISESAYSTMDDDLNYQYKVFGVPQLSLKHTHFGDEMVVTPYASAMALMVAPEEACHNLEQLSLQGLKGRYGLFEAIDYTPSRMSAKHANTVVRSFMVHHQGMSFLSFAYLLLNKPMQKRFLADPELMSSLLLLQEQIPKDAALYMPETTRMKSTKKEIPDIIDDAGEISVIHSPLSKAPGIQLLSNGKYQLMVTNDGNSFSHWEDLAINNWHKNGKGSGGVFCFIRDCKERTSWSTTYEPLCKNFANYTSAFSAGNAAFRCHHKDFESNTQIVTLPYDNIEMRQISIHNHSDKKKTIEVIGHTEALLAPINPMETPPVLDKSLYQTEVDCERHAIFYGRRTTQFQERLPWMFLTMTVKSKNISSVFYETDSPELTKPENYASAYKQREDNSAMPHTMNDHCGTVIAIKYKITIDPGETVIVKISIGIEEDKKSCLELLDRCGNLYLTDSLLKEVRNYNLAILARINASENDLQLFQQLAGAIVFSDQEHPDDSFIQHINSPLKKRTLIVRIKSADHIEVVEKIVQMHAYWRMKGLTVNIVIWNEDVSWYKYFLQRLIMELITNGVGAESLNRHDGGIFIKSIIKISDEDQTLLRKAACVIRAENWNSLSTISGWPEYFEDAIPSLEKAVPLNDLLFQN